MPQVVPYGKGPVIAKRRRGDPTPAEMQLLAQCVRGDGTVALDHPRGEERSPILVLAFEMQERGWLSPPGEPEMVSRPAPGPARVANYVESEREEIATVQVRVWRFSVTSAGRQAYQAQMERFGASR